MSVYMVVANAFRQGSYNIIAPTKVLSTASVSFQAYQEYWQ